MIFVKPNTAASADITASNLPALDYAAYVAATPYPLGENVSYNNHNYESLADANSGFQPDINPSKWLDLGVVNRFKMFDSKVSTQTESSTGIDTTIQLDGIISAISLLNVSADKVTVTMTDPYEGVVYTHVEDMSNSGVADWYAYFFEDYFPKESVALLDLPAYAGTVINLLIESVVIAKCGIAIIGHQKYIGGSKYGLSVGITDYSRKSVDEFGNASVVERGFSRKLSVPISIDTNKISYVESMLTPFRAIPALYIGSVDLPSTYVYGFYKDFSIVIPSSLYSDCNLEIEGLI